MVDSVAISGTDQFVEANGVRLRYRLEGQGELLVLVHGVSSRLEGWDGVVAALGGRFRTLRFDLRGHGRSEKVRGRYELADFVADLAGLLDALGERRCHLAGYSLGGLVAQGFALAHPDRLDRLVLVSTVAGRTDEERERVMARYRIVETGVVGEHFQNSVSRWFTEDFQRRHPEVIAAAAAENRKMDPGCYAAAYRVLATADLADRLGEIRRPTLVMTGENDIGSNPRMARLMAERIRGARLEILPGMRHSILTEVPDLVAGLIEAFLASPA
jgi:(E)-2-((N-methylformamido)methylene)succinate hydrolase